MRPSLRDLPAAAGHAGVFAAEVVLDTELHVGGQAKAGGYLAVAAGQAPFVVVGIEEGHKLEDGVGARRQSEDRLAEVRRRRRRAVR